MDKRADALWRAAGGRHGPSGRRRRTPAWLLIVAGGIALAVILALVLVGLRGGTATNSSKLDRLQSRLDQAEASRELLRQQLLAAVRADAVVVRQLLARVVQLEAALERAGVAVPAPNAAAGGPAGPAGSPGPAGPSGPPGTSSATPRPSAEASPTPRPTPRCLVRNPLTGDCLAPGLG